MTKAPPSCAVRDEPEAVEAGAAKRRCDEEKAMTTAVAHRTTLIGNAAAIERLRHMRHGLSNEALSCITSIRCDDSVYTVIVQPSCSRQLAKAIARSLEERSGCHNGIFIETEDGRLFEIAANWFEPSGASAATTASSW